MDTTFMNLENRKTSDPHRVTLNLRGKINLKRSDKYVSLSNLRNYSAWKNIKASYKNKFKISASMGSDKFELPDIHILYLIFKIILIISIKNIKR